MKNKFVLLISALALPATAAATVTIDYVTVADAGNAADSTGYGAVAYAYRISRNETSIGQYAAFLNAVASTDTYGLYNVGMSSSLVNGISQSGTPGNYSYSVAQGSANRPIAYVTWLDGARFCNWLHNGQPTGLQSTSTTEDGAYTLNGATWGVVGRNTGATVWIPSESEWYKAAYYDPNKGGAGVAGYWSYPTHSDFLAGNSIGTPHSANYFDGDYVQSGNAGLPASHATTDGGAYGANSASPYGTNDQGGNLWEFWDSDQPGGQPGLRGGSFAPDDTYLSSSFRAPGAAGGEANNIGFRVATVAAVPEPATSLLGVLAGIMLLRRRRKEFGSRLILAGPVPVNC